MHRIRFDEAVTAIVKNDSRFHRDAYTFLRDSLDYTVKSLRGDELEEHCHVTSVEMFDGFVEYCNREFGPMAIAILESWGVRNGSDIGAMVYNLIELDAFGKSKDDEKSDFDRWPCFDEALLKPYRPSRPVLAPRLAANENEKPKAQGYKPIINRKA